LGILHGFSGGMIFNRVMALELKKVFLCDTRYKKACPDYYSKTFSVISFKLYTGIDQ
jgi:hypothetical protein